MVVSLLFITDAHAAAEIQRGTWKQWGKSPPPPPQVLSNKLFKWESCCALNIVWYEVSPRCLLKSEMTHDDLQWITSVCCLHCAALMTNGLWCLLRCIDKHQWRWKWFHCSFKILIADDKNAESIAHECCCKRILKLWSGTHQHPSFVVFKAENQTTF